ncbi:hypothetical protein AB7W24_21800 [Providencia rettgeri]|uniref:hypothetical protein n=1 Tax=unclassified Providencia TaxID=2633465 RepID=UPI0013DFB6DF|nr:MULTISPECIES: hypothetical protein [unclassified Providencia]QIF57088.1 hypothetical protein FVA69_06150 [Providencia sp. 1701011]QIF61134.1 hypothetical protein FVA70_06165 [Providencia sp. 1701091]
MEYELYNNHEVHENIYLISINEIEEVLKTYNDNREISIIMNKCKNEPKNTWITKGDNLPRFNVPLLRVDDNNQLRITDGRHRIFWMKKLQMTDIPIAITMGAKNVLNSKHINIIPITTMDMPCSTQPEADLVYNPSNTRDIMMKLANLQKKI